MRYFLAFLHFLLWLHLAASAQHVAPITPIYYKASDTPNAAEYNATVGGAYTWMNANPVARLNKLTTKGDLYAHNGSAVERLAAGTDNYTLQASAAQPFGMSYANFSGTTAVTTKGDITGCDGDNITRIPVGANGYALQCDDTSPSGVSWVNLSSQGQLPKGACVPWTPTGAGTTTIPSGYLVADGSMGTPNLIGLFVLGTRPPGSSSTPSAGGYGSQIADAVGSGTETHNHSGSAYTTIDGTSGPNATVAADTGLGTASHPAHAHAGTAVYSAVGSANNAPAYYTCIYLVKE